MSLSSPRSATKRSAPHTANGTAITTASGKSQRSYSAARMRNAMTIASAKAIAAEHARGDEAVEAFELLGADDVRRAYECFQRHHLARRARAYVHRAQVLGLRAKRRIGLHL